MGPWRTSMRGNEEFKVALVRLRWRAEEREPGACEVVRDGEALFDGRETILPRHEIVAAVEAGMAEMGCGW